MGLIKEPLEVDLELDPRPLTESERQMIRDFIAADKLERAKALNTKKMARKRILKEKTV